MSIEITDDTGHGPDDHLTRPRHELGPWCAATAGLAAILGAAVWYAIPLPDVLESAIGGPAVGWGIGLTAVTATLCGVGVLLVGRSAPDTPWGNRIAEANTNAGLVVAVPLLVLVALGLAILSIRTQGLVAIAALGLVGSGMLFTGGFTREVKQVRPEPTVFTPPDDPSAFIHRVMPWSLVDYLGPAATGNAEVYVSRAGLAEAQAINPQRDYDANDDPLFGDWVTGNRCAEVDSLADRIREAAASMRLDPFLEVALAVSVVGSTPYKSDEESKGIKEYWRYPIETLGDGEGDCEDTAILLCAVLSSLGYQTCFFGLPQHAAIGVAGLDVDGGACKIKDGVSYYFIETTSGGGRIGDLPSDYTMDDLQLLEVIPALAARRPYTLVRTAPVGTWRRDGQLSWAVTAASAACVVALPLATWWQ